MNSNYKGTLLYLFTLQGNHLPESTVEPVFKCHLGDRARGAPARGEWPLSVERWP